MPVAGVDEWLHSRAPGGIGTACNSSLENVRVASTLPWVVVASPRGEGDGEDSNWGEGELVALWAGMHPPEPRMRRHPETHLPRSSRMTDMSLRRDRADSGSRPQATRQP
jgi:hypothetical protein